MPDVTMPRLSDSMEEGTIVRWLKADGDDVRRGESIAEVETDKATMEFEADAAGVLAIVAPEGATLAVGSLIATIGGGSPSGASAPGVEAAPTAAAVPAAAAHQPAAVSPPVAAGVPAVTAAPSAVVASSAAAVSPAAAAPLAKAATSPAPDPGGRLSASPLARRVAEALGVAIETIAGSGPYGRILKADVDAASNGAAANGAGARAAVASPLPLPSGQPVPSVAATTATDGIKGEVTIHETSRLQQVVARRMSESKATIPEFAIEMTVDMVAAVALRAQLKALLPQGAPSLNDLVIKAAAFALRRHPRLNGSFQDGRFVAYERVNVGVAVASDEDLIVPTVFDADRRSLGEVAAEVRRLAERVRNGQITPPELSGGTFTVSNLGMFGVDRFAGVINPPQAAILCVGAVVKRPAIAPDGAIEARDQMSITLVSDHRLVYGADAAGFLADVRAGLEGPLGVLI
jgi:pyruvate dehydrogenase E2 component (dihydrolipoamide acetyltransferase)